MNQKIPLELIDLISKKIFVKLLIDICRGKNNWLYNLNEKWICNWIPRNNIVKFLEKNMERMSIIYLDFFPKIIVLCKDSKILSRIRTLYDQIKNDNTREKLINYISFLTFLESTNHITLTNQYGHGCFKDILYLKGMGENFDNKWIQNSLYRIANFHLQIINDIKRMKKDENINESSA